MSWKWLLGLFVATGLISGAVWLFSDKEIIKPTIVSFNIERESGRGEEMEKLIATASGKWAVYVYRLNDEESWGLNENEVMPAA